MESKQIAVLMWIGAIFFWFLSPLLIFLLMKEDAYLQTQSKEGLNWGITALIGQAGAALLTILLIGPLLMWVIAVCNLVFCILGAIKCSNGDNYEVPFAIRLIQ